MTTDLTLGTTDIVVLVILLLLLALAVKIIIGFFK